MRATTAQVRAYLTRTGWVESDPGLWEREIDGVAYCATTEPQTANIFASFAVAEAEGRLVAEVLADMRREVVAVGEEVEA